MVEKNEATLPMIKQGPYIILDTTLRSQDAMWIDDLSGAYGDAGRTIAVKVIEQDLSNDPTKKKAMNLAGKNIRLLAHDANGAPKRIELATQIINPEAGIAQITIPKNFYDTVGVYQNAAFQIYGSDDNVVISSVPIAFEVYNLHVHAVTSEIKPFSDAFEALMKDLKAQSNTAIGDLNDRMGTVLTQVDTAQNTANNLDANLKSWTDLVKSKSVALLNEDNEFTGNMHVKGKVSIDLPVDAYTTGTSVQSFNQAHTQQNLDDETTIKKMPSFTQSLTYYSGNKLLNNPMSSDLVLVETTKISTMTAFQTAISQDMGKGEIKKRIIKNIDAGIQFGEWSTVERWSPWMSLIPYLTEEWMSKNKDYYLPEYRYKGDSIQLRGVIGTKGTIKHPENHYDRIPIANNLPFMGTTAIYRSAIWSGRHPYTLRIEGNEMFMERVYGSDHQLTDIDNSMMFTLNGDFPIDK